MKLIKEYDLRRMRFQGSLPEEKKKLNRPVVKLTNINNPDQIWLLSEYDEENNLCFGLMDLGMGFPEIGYLDLDEVNEVNRTQGNIIIQDREFSTTKTLEQLGEIARENHRIVI